MSIYNKNNQKVKVRKMMEMKEEMSEDIFIYYLEINKEFLDAKKEAQVSIDILYRKQRKYEKSFFSYLLSAIFRRSQSKVTEKLHA